MTRGDNIRRMLETDEGLADFFIEHGIRQALEWEVTSHENERL